LVCRWIEKQHPIDIEHLAPIHCDYDRTLDKKVEHSTSSDSFAPNSATVYTARVMLITGVKDPAGQTHLSHTLKFLVGKEDRSDLVALGGPWSSSKDGGDPATDDSVLIRTAM
jgi:hypothetical protein